jgi:hypothetical protein
VSPRVCNIRDDIIPFDADQEGNLHMSTDPKPRQCDHCDFGTGTRGMDRCARCDGTGSVFIVNGRYFPNTFDGYTNACVDAGVKPQHE